MWHQAIIVVTASWISQLLLRKPFVELAGRFDRSWFRNLFAGLVVGAALMIVPALFLGVAGYVHWDLQVPELHAVLRVTGMFVAVAVAEEFMFRGFIFQRLISSIGVWGAQILLAGYFLLTHMNNPGMTGSIQVLASINIFLASLLFGFSFLRTGSLAMPLGLHFMANWVQGTLLGFGVSGSENPSIMQPLCNKGVPVWLTGGSFGLEASVPGLVSVVIALVVVYRANWIRPHTGLTSE